MRNNMKTHKLSQAKHPETGEWDSFEFLDDYFTCPVQDGIRFSDGEVFRRTDVTEYAKVTLPGAAQIEPSHKETLSVHKESVLAIIMTQIGVAHYEGEPTDRLVALYNRIAGL